MNSTPSQQQTHALVTGASSGIGLHLAECFAADGIPLIVSARSAETLTALAAQWQQQYGVSVVCIPSDLSKPGAAQALVDTVRSKGLSVGHVVNNAGVGLFGEFRHSVLEGELSMMTLNMEALTILSKQFLPDVLLHQGGILNVASTASFQPGPYMAVYYATKAYVLSFTEAIAEELTGTGATVMALCPGPTASGFQDKAAMHDSALVKGKKLPTAKAVAVDGYSAYKAGRRVYIPGVMNWVMAQSVRFSPRRAVTLMVKLLSRPS
ncbi:MAG: SDR family NAD(P)-dependent oxidoreductase [Limnobacter sp.]|uniref:SDR family NAD(P)-dependent oxidoreductase n=1 Tax=Limnobacter sp. TaxID=2003368 RepID=UPI003919C91E